MMLNHTEIKELAAVVSANVIKELINRHTVTKWLTVEEAMRYFKVKSRETIIRWIKENYIYGFKRTGEWIIDRDSIERWYNSKRC